MSLPEVKYVRVIVGYGELGDEIIYTIIQPEVEKLSIHQDIDGPMSIYLMAKGIGGALNTGTV